MVQKMQLHHPAIDPKANAQKAHLQMDLELSIYPP